MKTVHTPGPWVVDYCRNYDEIVGPKDESIAQTGCWQDVEKPEQHANARLISAAPDLLEAAMSVLAWYEAETNHTKEPDFYKRIEMCRASEEALRAAISKATGETA